MSTTEGLFNLKASFLERTRVQLDGRLYDLTEALKLNKSLLAAALGNEPLDPLLR